MKKLIAILLLALTLSALAAGNSEKPNKMQEPQWLEYSSPRDIGIVLERIELRLQKINNEFASKLNKKEQQRLNLLLEEVMDLAMLLAERRNYRPEAISEGDLKDLREAIRKAAFADDQLQILQSASKGNFYTCAQIIGILELFPFSSDKLKALNLTFPRCLDPGNSFKIIDAFVFDKDEARKIIDATGFE